ncbi:MAG: DUF2197 domain-containing protein [Eubacteriales bacterium]
MDTKKCYLCDKEGLTRDEIGLTKKLLDKNATYFYCTDCLAQHLEVEAEFLRDKILEFKKQGCTLF